MYVAVLQGGGGHYGAGGMSSYSSHHPHLAGHHPLPPAAGHVGAVHSWTSAAGANSAGGREMGGASSSAGGVGGLSHPGATTTPPTLGMNALSLGCFPSAASAQAGQPSSSLQTINSAVLQAMGQAA